MTLCSFLSSKLGINLYGLYVCLKIRVVERISKSSAYLQVLLNLAATERLVWISYKSRSPVSIIFT